MIWNKNNNFYLILCCAFTEESADKSKNEYKNKSTHVNIRMIKHEKKYKNQSMECKIHKAGHEINFFSW